MTISKKYTAASAVMLVLLLAAAFLLFSPQSEGMTANAAGISLSSSQLSLGKGETCRLSVKGNYGSVKWQSSDSTVASVSGGSVTAKKNGVAVISAADKNGNTAKCRITVKNAPGYVKLTKGTLTLGIGETFTLGSSVDVSSASSSRIYRSSNSNVVKMTKTYWTGVFKAVEEGTAWVTVRLYNGVESTCRVTVKPAPWKVSVSKESLTLGVGESYTLGAVIPGGTGASKRTFRSSSSSIVKMTKTDGQGQFRAVKPGTAWVTVRLYNGKEASCRVTVKKAPGSVSISKKTLVMYVGQSASLSASVPSGTAATSRVFRTSNKNIVRMNNTKFTGKFTAVSAGTAWVTVRLYNGREASCKIEVYDKNRAIGNFITYDSVRVESDIVGEDYNYFNVPKFRNLGNAGSELNKYIDKAENEVVKEHGYISHKIAFYKNILSIVIATNRGYPYLHFYVYNIDVSTKKRVYNDEIFRRSGNNINTYKSNIDSFLEKAFFDRLSSMGQYNINTLSQAYSYYPNIKNDITRAYNFTMSYSGNRSVSNPMFIDDYGTMYVVLHIGSIAGADEYPHFVSYPYGYTQNGLQF